MLWIKWHKVLSHATFVRHCFHFFSFSESQPFTVRLNSNNDNEIICLLTLTILSMLMMMFCFCIIVIFFVWILYCQRLHDWSQLCSFCLQFQNSKDDNDKLFLFTQYQSYQQQWFFLFFFIYLYEQWHNSNNTIFFNCSRWLWTSWVSFVQLCWCVCVPFPLLTPRFLYCHHRQFSQANSFLFIHSSFFSINNSNMNEILSNRNCDHGCGGSNNPGLCW